ncbi:MAG: hypothetical protein NT135_03000, partial [Candidatus Berkelbacteria bacterium]|nr:hypothetical protein [Candidatus Berkelbacteria bacterium]
MMKRAFVWVAILIIFVVVALIGGGIYYYVKIYQPKISDQDTNWASYTNAQYNFSFKYPKEWSTTKQEITTLPGPASKDFIFGVSFYDPTEKKKVECVNAEVSGSFEGLSITQEDCQSILSKITQAEKDEYSGPRVAPDIYAYVYKKDAALSLY